MMQKIKTKSVVNVFSAKTKKVFTVVSLLAALSACTTYEYHQTKIVKLEHVGESESLLANEEELLDIGVVLFDDGIDILDDESAAYSSVRQSEAVWFSSQLKNTLERSNAWGLVRAVPNESTIIDVSVKGRLLESNGEVVSLFISAVDSTGQQWFAKEYSQQASSYAYNPEVNLPQDPFQQLFNEVANDLFDYRTALSSQQRLNIRSISKVRFARDFVPQAFDGYLAKTESGELRLQRIPADTDPMMQRVERIQARNDLFLDVIQDYYRAFNKNMSIPYNEWRKITYKEVVYERQLREQARKEKIASLVAIAGGIAVAQKGNSSSTRFAGQIGVISGASLFAKAFGKLDEANLHSETLREMGASLEAELEPSIVDLQDRSVTLTGTVEDQYQEWRRILSKMFLIDQGLSPGDVEADGDDVTLDTQDWSSQLQKGAVDK